MPREEVTRGKARDYSCGDGGSISRRTRGAKNATGVAGLCPGGAMSLRLGGARGRFGGDAVGAVALDAGAAQDAAEDSEADSGDEEEQRVSEMAGDVGEQEGADACVDEDGEDVAEGASRHGVPPARSRTRREGLLEPQSTL